MKTYQQCISCFGRQAQDVCTISMLGEDKTESVLSKVHQRIATFPADYPPIKMVVDIHDLIRAESSIADPYADIKKQANTACRKCVPHFAQIMTCSINSLETAVQLAIAGNIIDCGAYGLREVSSSQLSNIIKEVIAQPLKGESIKAFQKLISNSKQILYIADNAGECFFDTPLLELIPSDKLTYAVRGGPVLNDATMADAQAAGIQNLCPVIDTGDNAPGILLDRCSDEFIHAFESSDLIISKGQGNYESLSDVANKTIVFLTKVKCSVIAEDIDYPLNSNVIKILHARGNK